MARGVALGRPRGHHHARARRVERQRGDKRDKMVVRPAAERVAGAHVNNDQAIGWGHARSREARVDRRCGPRVHRHLDRTGGAIRTRNVERRQKIPLVLDRMPRPQPPRPLDLVCVHPAPSDDLIADSSRCAAEPCQQRRARPAVKIDGQVVAALAEAAAEREVLEDAFEAASPRRDDDFVEVRSMADYRSGRRLDDVGKMRVREAPPERVNGRRCENDVPNLAKPDQEDAHRKERRDERFNLRRSLRR